MLLLRDQSRILWRCLVTTDSLQNSQSVWRLVGYKDTRIKGYEDTWIQGYKSDNYFIEFTIVIILNWFKLHTSNYLQMCRDKIEML